MKPTATGLAIVSGAAFALADINANAFTIARLSIAGMTLGAAAATDLAEHRIPNRLVIPAAAACAALTVVSGVSAATAAGLGVILLLLVIALAVPSALGMGDIKLMLVVVLGLRQSALHALLLTVVLAGLAAVVTVIRKGREARRKALPLAPFLALGSLLALI